ncbi:MAG: D-isomer specific 2-hydroxyacid dehydrogenase family protein [Actinomycetota bacterium]|nr:D-isomer specific 2-hydroxyacid dehydrogenase family protein [Actinomycetota bacterium]
MPERHLIAVEPSTRPAMHAIMVEAVEAAGGNVVPIEQASALIFADPTAADAFPNIIGAGSGVEWIQLPYAGIETFQHHLDHDHTWTCGKGVYAPPVAEWIMAALLTAFRDIPRYVRASSWPVQDGKNLLGAKLTVLGGGGITESFMELIGPWGCDVTVVRRGDDPVPGAARTLTTDRLHEAVADADAVIVALALTDETRNIVDAETLAAMRRDAWLCNVGRGGHVVTDDLVTALREGVIAGAVLDVTDPEPLPDGHPLWELDNCVITPHVGNTPEMGLPLIADRVRVNVGRWIAGDELIGPVDVGAGY